MLIVNLILLYLLTWGDLPRSSMQDTEKLSDGLTQFHPAIGTWHVFYFTKVPVFFQGLGGPRKVRFVKPLTVEARDANLISSVYIIEFHNRLYNRIDRFEVSEFITCDADDSERIRIFGFTKQTTTGLGEPVVVRRSKFDSILVQKTDDLWGFEINEAQAILKTIGRNRIVRTILHDTPYSMQVVCQKVPGSANVQNITTD